MAGEAFAVRALAGGDVERGHFGQQKVAAGLGVAAHLHLVEASAVGDLASLTARLDSLGPAFRLTKIQQQRTEELLAESKQRRLTRAEQRELDALLHESEEVLLRRTAALDRLS